jgi:hypothetical protein
VGSRRNLRDGPTARRRMLLPAARRGRARDGHIAVSTDQCARVPPVRTGLRRSERHVRATRRSRRILRLRLSVRDDARLRCGHRRSSGSSGRATLQAVVRGSGELVQGPQLLSRQSLIGIPRSCEARHDREGVRLRPLPTGGPCLRSDLRGRRSGLPVSSRRVQGRSRRAALRLNCDAGVDFAA